MVKAAQCWLVGGIATKGARLKDAVVIVNGRKLPLLIRRDSSGRLQFLSQAYVDGIMHVEVLRKILLTKLRLNSSHKFMDEQAPDFLASPPYYVQPLANSILFMGLDLTEGRHNLGTKWTLRLMPR